MFNVPEVPIAAILFDMDGLMIDTERMAQRAWQRAGAEFGFTLPDELYLQAVGRTAKATEALFRAGLGVDFPFEAEVRQTFFLTAAWIGLTAARTAFFNMAVFPPWIAARFSKSCWRWNFEFKS